MSLATHIKNFFRYADKPSYWIHMVIPNNTCNVVQIGSNDGVSGDPIHHLLIQKDKWKALFVEPVPYIYQKLKENYKGRINSHFENTAINDGTSQSFYYISNELEKRAENIPNWYNQLGSFDKQHLYRHFDSLRDDSIEEMEVQGLSLNGLFRKYEIDKIELLHVDAEGYDWKILSQLDSSKPLPTILLFEYGNITKDEKEEALFRLHKFYKIYEFDRDYLCIKKDRVTKFIRFALNKRKVGPIKISVTNSNISDPSDLYSIPEIDFKETEKVSQVFDLILNKAPGFIIKNAIGSDSINKLIRIFDDLKKREKAVLYGDVINYPLSFISHLYEKKVDPDYFTENRRMNEEIKEKYNLDIAELFSSMLSVLNDGKPVKVKRHPFLDGQFAPFQFRSLDNNRAQILVHCENDWYHKTPELNDTLGDEKLQPNPIPFFITLKKPRGGELVLYDLYWEQGQYSEFKENESTIIHTGKGDKYDSSSNGIKRMKVATSPGDLFVFNGANIWHSVDPIENDQERLTIGAFINITKDGQLEIFA